MLINDLNEARRFLPASVMLYSLLPLVCKECNRSKDDVLPIRGFVAIVASPCVYVSAQEKELEGTRLECVCLEAYARDATSRCLYLATT